MRRLFLFLKLQLSIWFTVCSVRCTVSDRKDTKLLKAIHNPTTLPTIRTILFQTAKIQNF